ncbi:hemerythrin domain-containing protein [Methylobacterium sp. 17Sr1-1]|uniref:hemerythrin domain-containing protein n=1 Tax=Methylobacterium sp. 17Sr1-1 TaxID=2202826 RepID=UPI000D6ED42F|nr:hemerythrin domain-containing protein [Methylobacterium sp. 17Sr1-1]AWN54629.1 hemerythrin domain-containing protein [Methylobacterium sp. 17Sr1-1]
MDIWRLIERDHANINQLIHEIPNALNGAGVVRSRERLLADLIDELRSHGTAIDASLIAPLRSHAEAKSLIEELAREHDNFTSQLNGLAKYDNKGLAGWLNTFEDVTYLVDQHLHRHRNELLPMARRLLSYEGISKAASTFIRAKSEALRAGGQSRQSATGPSEFFLVAAVGLAAAGAALLAWRFGLLRGTQELGRPGGRSDGMSKGQPLADLAAASAPGNRVPGEDLSKRQDQLLDEAIEETFPASDPISPKRITK